MRLDLDKEPERIACLLKLRESFFEKKRALDRSIFSCEYILVSCLGWERPKGPSTSIPPPAFIAYNDEAREYVEITRSAWGEQSILTTAGFIEWLETKFEGAPILKNSARGAFLQIAKKGLIRLIVEGSGRIGATYGIVSQPSVP